MITELRVAADHAAFAGHFPGLPILPGAVLLDETLYEIMRGRDLDLLRWRLASAKFLERVRPGDLLTIEHTAASATTIRFSVTNTGKIVATGMLSAIAPEPGEPGVAHGP